MTKCQTGFATVYVLTNKASHNDLFLFRKKRYLQKKRTKGIGSSVLSVLSLAQISCMRCCKFYVFLSPDTTHVYMFS